MGGGKSSGSSSAVLTPEQTEQLKAQTGFLKETLIPAYQKTVGGAENTLNTLNPYVADAAKAGYGLAGNVAQSGVATGANMIGTGATGLASLFDPNYEKGQVQAALQAGREAARESQAGQNAMYGGAGGLGSARQALADRNLRSLNEQRQATAAAGAQAQVQANKAAAAQSLMGAGGSLLQTGLGAAGQQVGMANAPMDLYQKYASIVYGTPGSAGGNFAGTQGQTGSSKGFGVNANSLKSMYPG